MSSLQHLCQVDHVEHWSPGVTSPPQDHQLSRHSLAKGLVIALKLDQHKVPS